MAINFPANPNPNDVHPEPSLGKSWIWDGVTWKIYSSTTTGIGYSDLSVVTDVASGGGSLTYNDANGQFTFRPAAGSGGGATNFTGLGDTPGSLSAGKWLKVNTGGTALEWTDAPSGSDTNDYLNTASLSGTTLTLTRTGSQSLSDVTVDLSSLGGSGATVTTDDNAPGSPSDGDLWWKSDEGRLKVYYADANTSQWVDASPPLAVSSSSITNTTTNGTNSITTTTSTGGANANAIEIKTDNSTASAVRWRFTPNGHFIPNVNAAYDIGNAEYKVRHLFLSDNTMYYEGDFLKVAQHNSGGSAQAASYLIPLAKLKDALNASGDYEAFKNAILAITDA